MWRGHEGGYRIEVEMAICLGRRRIHPEGEARRGLVELQFDGIRPIDSRLVDRTAGQRNSNGSRPDREKRRPGGKQGEREVRRVQERTYTVISRHIHLDLDVDVQEVEESIPVRVLAGIGMWRGHEGGYRIEVEMAIGLRGVCADIEQGEVLVDQDEVYCVRPIDTALVNEPTVEPDREDRRPHRKTRGGRVVDLQTVIGIMERPENRKKSRHRNLNTRVHEEKVKQAVPVRIVSAVGMRRGEIAGAGEHGGPSRHTARDGL